MDQDELGSILELQDGVIARRQAIAVGVQPHDIRRLLHRREWARVESGVYVNHTGPLTWQQRAWSAVLFCWPAALCHDTAIRAADGPGRRGRDDEGPLHVAIDRTRSFAASQDWIVTHRLADLTGKAQWSARPPRLRIEQAVVDVAAECPSEFDAIATLANAVQSRRTTAGRLREPLDTRTRIARRRMLEAVLRDIDEGTCSLLEQAYLDRVERAHGLPRGQRQLSVSARGPIYRDVTYMAQAMVVELDGRQFHDNAAARDRDLDRDLDAAVDGLFTVRLGWGQVFSRACRTAQRIGTLLARRGWEGKPTSCPDCPPDG